MEQQRGRWIWKLFWLVVVLIAIIAGGDLIFVVLEEAVELVVDATHALFMLIFERWFGMPYAKAQGRAAWTSIGLLVLIVLFGIWRLIPRVKARIAESRQCCRNVMASTAESWRAARWYQKLLLITGGVSVLFGLAMLI